MLFFYTSPLLVRNPGGEGRAGPWAGVFLTGISWLIFCGILHLFAEDLQSVREVGNGTSRKVKISDFYLRYVCRSVIFLSLY